MTIVGIIANPNSGKDIRRLVGQAVVVSNREKVNIVKRCIIGLHSAGVKRVLIMPDRFGIGIRAIQDLRVNIPNINETVKVLDIMIVDASDDSTKAAMKMCEMGAKGIITLGGDGTVRVVAKGAQGIPLLPISTGTNNVLSKFTEGTIAGLAMGKFVQSDKVGRKAMTRQQKKLEIFLNDELVDFALVDIVAIAGMHLGSRAIWDVKSMRQIAVSRALRDNIGLSNIAAQYEEVSPEENTGLIAKIGSLSENSMKVYAAIGPGMISEVYLSDIEKMKPGRQYVIVNERPLVLALDGEREHVLSEGDSAYLKLSMNGPNFIDIHQALSLH